MKTTSSHAVEPIMAIYREFDELVISTLILIALMIIVG